MNNICNIKILISVTNMYAHKAYSFAPDQYKYACPAIGGGRTTHEKMASPRLTVGPVPLMTGGQVLSA